MPISFWWYFRLQAVSTFFNNIHTLALPLWFFQVTGSRLESAMVFVISGFFSLVSLPFVGVILDRFSNRKLLIGVDLLRGLVIAILAFYSTAPSFVAITIIACVSSVCSTVFSSLQQAIIKRNAPPGESVRAQATLSAVQGAALIIAPSVGAIIVAAYGYRVVFLLNAASFLIGMLSFKAVKESITRTVPMSFVRDTREGLMAVAKNSTLKAMLFLGFVNAFASGSLGILYVQHFSQASFSMQDIALLMAGQGVGIVLGSNYFAKAPYFRQINAWVVGMVVGICLMTISIFGTVNLYATMLVLAVTGLFSVVFGIALRTTIQEHTQEQFIGRVSALMSLVSVVGSFLSISALTASSTTVSTQVQLLVFGLAQLTCCAAFWIAMKVSCHES